MKFIAKPNTWFDEGTEVELLFDIHENYGLFCGLRNGHLDEESCMYDEFEVISDVA